MVRCEVIVREGSAQMRCFEEESSQIDGEAENEIMCDICCDVCSY